MILNLINKMGFYDIMNYALFTNPVSSGASSYAKTAAVAVRDFVGLYPNIEVKMVQAEPIPLWRLAAAGGPFVRLAAISGAAAVILGAYGSHTLYTNVSELPAEKLQDQQRVFETASRYHFIHTLALLGLPLCRAPLLAGAFTTSGMLMFCGTCYYYAFTGEKRYRKLTPIGGICFILGWLGMFI